TSGGWEYQDQSGAGDREESHGVGGEAMGPTRSEVRTIVAATREKMAEYAASHPGTLTAGMVAEAKNKGMCLVSCKRELSAHLTTTARTNRPGDKTSYRRVSRRFRPFIGGRSIVMPERISETFYVGRIIDTSASTRLFQTEGDILKE